MVETKFFVEVDCGRVVVIAFEEQVFCAEPAGFVDGVFQEPAADALTLNVWVDGKFDQLEIIFRIFAFHHGQRADWLPFILGHEDVAARVDDVLHGMVQLIVVYVLYHPEDVAYPPFVERFERLMMTPVVIGCDVHFFHCI